MRMDVGTEAVLTPYVLRGCNVLGRLYRGRAVRRTLYISMRAAVRI